MQFLKNLFGTTKEEHESEIQKVIKQQYKEFDIKTLSKSLQKDIQDLCKNSQKANPDDYY